MSTTCLHTPAEATRWLRARVTGALRTDSRQLQAGDGFVAWPGARTDGRRFVADALAAGARACLVEQEGADALALPASGSVARYAGLKRACGPIASLYYGQPSQGLKLVAVTGTNGKTSTTWWLAAALTALGRSDVSPCALVGTLGVGRAGALTHTGLTTPDPVLLQARLADFVAQGVRSCALEASSIGLAEHRLDGAQVDVAVFTNFTRDHLDYHHDMAGYWQAKRRLFDWAGLRAAVVNLDDARGAELAAHVAARRLAVWTVSLQGRSDARLRASDLHRDAAGGLCWRVHDGEQVAQVHTALLAEYNAANLMAVLAVLRALDVPLQDAVRVCAQLPAVPGRMERLQQAGKPLAVIDFAHTPDALEHVLRALRPLAQQRGGRLWCVFGCGGNRDASKRPLMAQAVETLADRVVLTSDNPRDEEPLAIMAQIRAGLQRPAAATEQPDRAAAIAAALQQAAPADVVLIAGKGHERWQEVAGRKLPFSDHQQAEAALQARPTAEVRA